MRFFVCLLLLAFLAMPAYAARDEVAMPARTGGFEGPVSGAEAETVASALKLHQDSRVALTGNILSRVAGEQDEYIFGDATGKLPVYITEEQFKGYTVTPEVLVRLSGKLEKLAKTPDTARVKVKLLEIVKQ